MRAILKYFFLFLFLTSYAQNSTSTHQYKCAALLSEKEIEKYQNNTFKNYTEIDLDVLATMTTFIIDSNPEKDSYECFFNKSEKDLWVFDVLGLENEDQIDKTLCLLIKNKEIKLPKNTILLFHKYVNEFDDGGIIVGLKIVH